MKDKAMFYHEYVNLVMKTECPNGASKCTGIEHCPYNLNYPSNYQKCEVKEYVEKNGAS
jgi:hypothetical protein